MSPASTFRGIAAFGIGVLFACDALAAVGTVQFAAGDVKIRDVAGKMRTAQKGGAIDEGEMILTGAVSSVQLKMSDGGILAVRPETELKIDTYRFIGREDGTENAVMSLLKGGFRTITGIIGRTNKNNYRVNTATATIGIRGTDHEPFVILPVTAGAPQPPASPGTYDKVNVGEAFISSPLGTVNISQNQVGFAAPNIAPTILPVMPEFFKATPSIITAAAQAPAEPAAAAPAAAPTAAAPAAPAPRPSAPTVPGAVLMSPTSTPTTVSSSFVPAVIPLPTTNPSTPTTATTVVTAVTATPVAPTVAPTPPLNLTTPASSLPIAQASQTRNPAVASSNYVNFVFSQKPVTGGTETAFIESSHPQGNTTYLLNQSNDLIDIHGNLYVRIGANYTAQASIANADFTFTGGVGKDEFQAADGTVYMGRWQGGQVNVTDLATTGVVAPFSDSLGPTSAHWVIGLVPANSPLSTTVAPINSVQTLLGTATYNLTAATHPTDSLGNVGTLNSASLTANFTSQTVNTSLGLSFSTTDPVNISNRNLSMTASGTNAPISGAHFQGSFPSVGCTGTGCGSNPYVGLFSGGFGASASAGTTTGAVGTGAALGYRLFSVPTSPSVNQPFSDVIDGAVVFSTASAPTPAASPTPVCSTCAFRSQVFYPVNGSTAGTTFFAQSSVPGSSSTVSTTPSIDYLLDSSGNLVRVLTSSWNVFERAAASQCTGGAPCLTSPGPGATANTLVTMAGGTIGTGGATFSSSTVISSTTATERYSDSTGIRIGRYEGGTVTVHDLASGSSLVSSLTGPLGPRSVDWVIREQPTSIPISGRFDYTPTFATKPTDTFGSTNGTLLNAQLTADFTAMTVQPEVRVLINNQGLAADASGVPIQSGSFGFNVSSASDSTNPSFPSILQVGCSGTNCAPSPAAGGRPYGGRIIGGFSGDGTANGAFFRYTFTTRFDPTNATDVATAASLSRPINDYISGLVAFGKGAQVAQPAPTGGATIATAYFDMPVGGTFGSSDTFRTARYQTSPTSFTITGGNLVSVSDDPAFNFPVASESISGGTAVSGGVAVDATALAATGIIFGRYDAMKAGGTGAPAGSGTLATLTGAQTQNLTSTSFTRNILGSYQWFKGPEPFPFGLSGALTGTASYSLVGYTPPTDQNSLTGSVSTVSTDTNLSVNFDRQAVSMNMKVTMPPSIGPTPGTQNRVWVASASNLLLKDFDAHFGFGSNSVLSISLNGSSAFGDIQGGLTGTGLNGAGIAYAFGGFDPLNSGSHEHVNGALAFSMSSYNPGAANAPSGSSINLNDVWYRVGIVSAGLLNPQGTFKADRLFFTRPVVDANQRTALNANGLPVAFDATWSLPFPSGCTLSCSGTQDIAGRLSIVPSDVSTAATALSTTATPASLVNTGIDQGTGIRWGRYASGSVALFDRISGSAVALINVTNQPMHVLFTAPQTGPTTLPISGTANYVLVGNTNPTDNFGHVGTLGSATLNADFGAQTVSSGVNLTVNSQTWSASVTNAPILKGSFFFAEKLPGGGGSPVPLTVTSSLGTNTAGTLLGAFTGTSGQGAGLSYALNVNGSTGTTVSGVAAFRRP